MFYTARKNISPIRRPALSGGRKPVSSGKKNQDQEHVVLRPSHKLRVEASMKMPDEFSINKLRITDHISPQGMLYQFYHTEKTVPFGAEF